MIDADHAQFPEVGSDKPSFIIVSRYAHPLLYMIGFLAAEQGHAAVPLFLGGEAICRISGFGKFQYRYLVWLGLGFLQADYVCTAVSQPFDETFAGGRADAVEIVGDDSFCRHVPIDSVFSHEGLQKYEIHLNSGKVVNLQFAKAENVFPPFGDSKK